MTTVEQVGGISADEPSTLNKSLHRLDRFWDRPDSVSPLILRVASRRKESRALGDAALSERSESASVLTAADFSKIGRFQQSISCCERDNSRAQLVLIKRLD